MTASRQAHQAHNAQLETEELQVEIQELEVAQAASHKTAFDEFLINSWLAVAYAGQRDYARAVPALQAAAESQYASPQQRKQFMQAAASMLQQMANVH